MFAISPAPKAAQEQAPQGENKLSIDELVDRINKAESAVTARMRGFHPIVEVYIQNLAPDPKLGTVPTKDEYFLGQFEGKDGTNVIPLSHNHGSFKATGVIARPFGVQYLPSGFAAATVPDWRLMDAQRYEFMFVRRIRSPRFRSAPGSSSIRGAAASSCSGRPTCRWPPRAKKCRSRLHR